MNRIEDRYKELAVRIVNNGIYGSGCLFQTEEEYSYVLTAKHCIIENDGDEVIKDNVKITRFNKSNNQLTILDIYLHESFDIALIKVSNVSIEAIGIHKPDKNDKLALYGYPNKLKTEEENRVNLECQVSFRQDNYFEVEADSIQFTFEDGVDENILGLSGSGAFYEKDDELFLSGIFTRLKADNGAYNKYCVLNIELFDKITSEKNISSLNINNFTFQEKSQEELNKVFFSIYQNGFEEYYFERDVDKLFSNYLNSNKNIWINGISGVGKTNLVFRNLITKNSNSHWVDLSTVNSENINDYFDEINQEIIELFDIKSPYKKRNIFVQISTNLEKCPHANYILFVDEIPLVNERMFEEFVNGFITISEHYNKKIKYPNIRFVISTKKKPKSCIETTENYLNTKQKANKNFFFIDISKWDNEELIILLNIIIKEFNYTINEETQKKILKVSKGLPNILKDIFQKLYYERCSIGTALRETELDN